MRLTQEMTTDATTHVQELKRVFVTVISSSCGTTELHSDITGRRAMSVGMGASGHFVVLYFSY